MNGPEQIIVGVEHVDHVGTRPMVVISGAPILVGSIQPHDEAMVHATAIAHALAALAACP